MKLYRLNENVIKLFDNIKINNNIKITIWYVKNNIIILKKTNQLKKYLLM